MASGRYKPCFIAFTAGVAKKSKLKTEEIAQKLVAFCRTGDFKGAQQELFADDAESIEPVASPDFDKVTKGKEAIFKKGEKFDEMVDSIHNIEISEPIISSSSFAILLRMTANMKNHGETDMKELCVYKVKDGKIISEEFFM